MKDTEKIEKKQDQSMYHITLILVSIGVLIAGYFGIQAIQKKPSNPSSSSQSSSNTIRTGGFVGTSTPTKSASSSSAMSTKPAVYTEYSKEALANSATNHTFLFFHAPWCSYCKAADSDLQKNLSQIENVTILKIDYDSANELRAQYQVNQQSTWILVDKTGKDLTRAYNLTSAAQIDAVHREYMKSIGDMAH